MTAALAEIAELLYEESGIKRKAAQHDALRAAIMRTGLAAGPREFAAGARAPPPRRGAPAPPAAGGPREATRTCRAWARGTGAARPGPWRRPRRISGS